MPRWENIFLLVLFFFPAPDISELSGKKQNLFFQKVIFRSQNIDASVRKIHNQNMQLHQVEAEIGISGILKVHDCVLLLVFLPGFSFAIVQSREMAPFLLKKKWHSHFRF